MTIPTSYLVGIAAWASGLILAMGGFIAQMIRRQNDERKEERTESAQARLALQSALDVLRQSMAATEEREKKIDELVRKIDDHNREVQRQVAEALRK